MSRLTRLRSTLHLLTPTLVVLAALLYHGLGHPIPTLTLVTLISAAYGKALWQDFLDTHTIRGTIHRAEASTPSDRDAVLGVEPTR